MKDGKFIGILLMCLFLIVLLSSCVSKRVIIWNNDACSRYIEFRDSVAQLSLDEKELNEERVQMLKASCAYSYDGLPVPGNHNPYHTHEY